MGDGRTEGSSTIGDGGQAAIFHLMLMAQVLVPRGIQFYLRSGKKWPSNIWVAAPFPCHRRHGSTGLYSGRLLQPS